MKIVFFQDIISLHFAAFLKELSNTNEVYLFADESISKERLERGWKIPDTGKTTIHINKGISFVNNFIDENDNSYFIFSGLHSVKSCILAFKYAIKKKVRQIGIMSEGYKSHDFKIVLRIIRSRFFYFKYRKKIKFIFAMGNLGLQWYIRAGFSKKIIFQWTYFIDNKIFSVNPNQRLRNKNFSLLFVGELNSNKRILKLINVVKDISGVNLKVVGDGKFKTKVQRCAEIYSNIQYLGIQKNSSVFEIMKNSDLLILPSKHDGWGAVVNESLHLGTPVLCTDTCGSSILLDGEIRGESFKWSNEKIKRLILKWKNKKDIETNRHSIIKWSKNISASKAKDYFIKTLKYISTNSNGGSKKPIAPWLK